ncbi:MAG: lactate racemase domain-containing protein [Candidatus Thorarchaeota archaeon]
MRFDVRYGEGSLPLEIPERLPIDTLVPITIEESINTEQLVADALEKPLNTEPFSRIISGVDSIAIVVNSGCDPRPNAILLNAVLKQIRASLSGPTNILHIIPMGFVHSISQSYVSNETNNLTGADYHQILHRPSQNEDLSFVGETPTHCTPVYVNKAFMDAELKIGIGTIRSDVFVGATGGRMSVLPYSCGIKSISRNYKLQATTPVGPFVVDSAVCIDLEEASRLACLDFIVNAIPDWQDNISNIVTGDPYTAWKSGLPLVRNLTETSFRHKADIAIISAGGSFNDRTLYDAIDALNAGKEATEHGGVIILVAECADGPGPNGFIKGVSECNSSEEILLLAETGFEIGMEKARFFVDTMNSREVIICSRLRESLVEERFRCSAVKDPQEGYELAKSLIVSTPRIAVIPHGNRTLPVMKNG